MNSFLYELLTFPASTLPWESSTASVEAATLCSARSLVQYLQRQRLEPHRIRQGTADIVAGEHIGDKSGVHKSFSGSDDYPDLWVYRLLSAIRLWAYQRL